MATLEAHIHFDVRCVCPYTLPLSGWQFLATLILAELSGNRERVMETAKAHRRQRLPWPARCPRIPTTAWQRSAVPPAASQPAVAGLPCCVPFRQKCRFTSK